MKKLNTHVVKSYIFKCLIITMPLVFMLSFLHSEATPNQTNQHVKIFRIYYGSTPAISGSTGLSYTVYASYNPTTTLALIDGVDDMYGNPVTINSISWSNQNWDASTTTLTLTDLKINFTYSGGSDNINSTLSFVMN